MSNASAVDGVFKALADPTRRLLLDRLREHNGQTLAELCAHLDMARQSVTQHLDILGAANLVTVVRRGRERLHYLNPTPIHEIEERWISGFDKPRLQAISAIRNQAEEDAMTSTTTIPTYVYVTYIRAGAEQVWQALTDADLTARVLGPRQRVRLAAGLDLGAPPHRRLGRRRRRRQGARDRPAPPARHHVRGPGGGEPSEGPTEVTFLIEPHEGIVRLTVTHENVPTAEMLSDISTGWPAVLANLKSLLETGDVLSPPPYEMSPPTS